MGVMYRVEGEMMNNDRFEVVKVHPPDIDPPVGVPAGPIETLEKYSISEGNVPEKGSYITVNDGEEYVTYRVQEVEVVVQDGYLTTRIYTESV